MDLILYIIWPGLISACVHVLSLRTAVKAKKNGAGQIASVAISLCQLAILVSIFIPFLAFIIAFNLDYACIDKTLGVNTCLLLKILPFPILIILNLATWQLASRVKRTVILN